jgi:DNA-directed RNA polymerase alpha subunit
MSQIIISSILRINKLVVYLTDIYILSISNCNNVFFVRIFLIMTKFTSPFIGTGEQILTYRHCVDSRVDPSGPWFARFHIGPFYRGTRLQIGTSIRRSLLNDLSGPSVVAVELEGALHESTIDILFQFRKRALVAPLMGLGEIVVVPFLFIGPGTFYLGDIQWPSGFYLHNPITIVTTVSSGAILRGRRLLQKGYGWSPFGTRSLQVYHRKRKLPRYHAYTPKSSAPIYPWLSIGFPIRPVERVGFRIEPIISSALSIEILVLDVRTIGSSSPLRVVRDAAVALTYKFARLANITKPLASYNQYLRGTNQKRYYPHEKSEIRIKTWKKTFYSLFETSFSRLREPLRLDLINLDLTKESYLELTNMGFVTIGHVLESLVFESDSFSTSLKEESQRAFFQLGLFPYDI